MECCQGLCCCEELPSSVDIAAAAQVVLMTEYESIDYLTNDDVSSFVRQAVRPLVLADVKVFCDIPLKYYRICRDRRELK
jgi:hypothetical protein